ncbi:MAG: tRNA uridine-5-carboxymethylaminomethyl(34) synthesis GTPase MnmE [Oscillospiraceae bacterium]|nr:tRNA uridine-5-carboxymethylaminomethyl(34) synthesis GTPase MnmE [Oscillospiraceae bacterium]
MSDTIAAISTGNQLAGIGVIRLSGDDAIAIAEKVFTPERGRPMSVRRDRLLVYGTLRDRSRAVIDRCLCFVSRGPHSYTGEDTAELQCHGSPTVLREAMEALFAAGARQARQGEFTKRAFLNGRMDLTQAEAVIDLIEAESVEAARNAAGQLGGAVSRRTDEIYNLLRDISSHYHAVVDYPDEDIEDFRLEQYTAALAEAEGRLSALLRSFERGRVLTGGIPTAIVGRPNVGKSTLLNALLGYERAIVTEIPGTTRDTLTERARIGGVLLRLTDTAGLRETSDAVERLGVERSRSALAEAELILLLLDAAAPAAAEERELLDTVRRSGKPRLILLNKTDIAAELPALDAEAGAPERVLPVSAKTGAGLDAVERAVAELFPAPEIPAGEILTNARHADAVGRALRSVREARKAIEYGVTPDAVLTETEAAMSALGELSGRSLREDITGRIFERFCVGK